MKGENMSNYRQETLCIHSGYEPEAGDPQVMPLAQSTTYRYYSSEHVAKLFDLEAEGHMYTRISNPTVANLEKKLTALEEGIGALCLSSGQAATTISLLNVASCGDHIVVAKNLYGGSVNLLNFTFQKFGIEVTPIDTETDIEEIKKSFRDNTKAIFVESLSNPMAKVLDFEKFAELSEMFGVPLIVDNTLATPYLCQPLKHGAHIVTHSTTKYLDGHATSVGGAIIDGGTFNWNNGKFPDLVDPDPSYHGLSYLQTFGSAAYIVKARTHLLRDLGMTMSPYNAYQTHQAIDTLHIRMDRHCENALKVAEFLDGHPAVEWVSYPYLKTSDDYEKAQKYMPKGSGGVICFVLSEGKDKAKNFIDSLKLISLVVHVGDLRTCVLHPASMTHRQLTDEQLKNAGVEPGLVRLSVGLENVDDIIEDLKQALEG
jgi:O-acetylhomoserine (thiol)-lyase